MPFKDELVKELKRRRAKLNILRASLLLTINATTNNLWVDALLVWKRSNVPCSVAIFRLTIIPNADDAQPHVLAALELLFSEPHGLCPAYDGSSTPR